MVEPLRNVNVTYESRRNLDENNSYTATVFSTLAADPITPVYRDNLVDIPDFLQTGLWVVMSRPILGLAIQA